MKNKLVLLTALLALLASCGSNVKENKEKASNDYKEALGDSVKNIVSEIDSCKSALSSVNDNVGTWLRDFTVVENPREVEGYYIMNGWQKRYPLYSTGIIARLTKGEEIELIASLQSGRFNRIEVRAGDVTVTSGVVAYDQALNYVSGSLNTVMFSGSNAEDVARMIADNELNQVKLIFLEGNKVAGSWNIPTDYKKMISTTWMLYSSRKEQIRLENRELLLQKKLDILRRHIDK